MISNICGFLKSAIENVFFPVADFYRILKKENPKQRIFFPIKISKFLE